MFLFLMNGLIIGRVEWDKTWLAISEGDHLWAFTCFCCTSNAGLLSECFVLTIMGSHSLSSLGENCFIILDLIFRAC